MKKIVHIVLLASVSLASLIACNRVEEPKSQGPLNIILRAGAPETRTSITYDGDKTYTPSWSANDAIGVYFTEVEETATEFVNETAGATAFFEPSEEITGVSGNQTLYAFYPLSAFNALSSGKSIRVNVKDTQTPDALGTFDKSTDILVAKPYNGNVSTISDDGGIIDLAFARILSVIKVTPTDATADGAFANEYVKSVKIEYNGSNDDTPLTGRVVLDLETGELGDWTIKTYSVSAGYNDNVFSLNGTNAAYLLVNPTSIPSGKQVTFTVKTDHHDATKTINLSKALTFPAGNIAIINLSIDETWTITDNTLDPNIIFKTPFTADISSNTSYNVDDHGNLGVVGTSSSSITYSFAGTYQLRNNANKISADDASFYWCTSTTSLTISGINASSNQYFNLSFDRKVPSGSATLALTISEDGEHFFPLTSNSTVTITGTTSAESSFNFSIPEGQHTNLSIKFENSGSGVTIDNVTLTKLAQAGSNNKIVSFEVIAVDPNLVVTPSPVNLIAGATQQLAVTGTDGAITYSSNNEDIATVNETGLITAVAEGTTTIDIASAATANYNAGSTSVTVTVSAELTFETVIITETWSADLKTNQGNNLKFVDDGQGIWTIDATYGHKAANTATSASFYSPKFDMSSVTAGSITFAHTGNVTGDDYQSLGKAYYTIDDGATWTQIALDNPTSNWSWKTATIPSSVYAGETIQFRWDFQGNASKTWEVKDFVITVPVVRTITLTQPSTGGTISATVDNNPIASGATVEVGKTISLTAVPATGYEFLEWDVEGASLSDVTANPATITVGASNITVSATFALESTATPYTYIFTSKSWGATRDGEVENWTSGLDGNQLTTDRGIQVTSGTTGANGTSKYPFTDVEEIEVTYSTNANDGAGSVSVNVGDGTAKTQTVTKTGGTSDRILKFRYTDKESGNIKLTVDCTKNSIFIKSVTIKAATINLPTAYAITCATNLDHGSVKANKATAYAGDIIDLTATPASGYRLEAWTVYKTGDQTTKVTVTNNSFEMPAFDVTVSASFTSSQGGGTATFTFGTNISATSGTINGVTLSTAKNSGNEPVFNSSYNQLRLYRYNSMTLSCASNITSIEITYDGTNIGSDTAANVGSYSCTNSVGTWTGSSNSVTITNTGTANVQMRITEIVVTYE